MFNDTFAIVRRRGKEWLNSAAKYDDSAEENDFNQYTNNNS